MSEIKYTKTASFIFPLLDIPKDLFLCDVKNIFGKTIVKNRFINAYLEDSKIDKYSHKDGYIKLLIHPYQDLSYRSFYDTLTSFNSFEAQYEREGNQIFIFKIPNIYEKDFRLIVENGYYSKISDTAKKLIMANHFFSGQPYLIPLILTKSVTLKESWEERLSSEKNIVDLGEQEVWPVFDYEKEILKDTDLLQLKSCLTKVGEE